MSGLTQEDVLAYHWEDADRMFEVRDILAISPEIQFHLFLENPLENGYYLYSISDHGMCNHGGVIMTACDYPFI